MTDLKEVMLSCCAVFFISDSQRIGGGSGYWAIVVLFVICLVAVGAFILYKFKRQVKP